MGSSDLFKHIPPIEADANSGGQSLTGGCFILLNVIVALAILNMPYCFLLGGPAAALVMLAVGGLSILTATLSGEAWTLAAPLASLSADRDWAYLGEVAFGRPG